MELDAVVDRFRGVEPSLTGLMDIVAGLAGNWVEIRHVPAADWLDGWRKREDFIAYIKAETVCFPKTFDSMKTEVRIVRVDDYIAWDPLSFSGSLRGQDRVVDIRHRVTLHFERDRLVRMSGSLTADNVREDVIAWLKTIRPVGGFEPPPAIKERPHVLR